MKNTTISFNLRWFLYISGVLVCVASFEDSDHGDVGLLFNILDGIGYYNTF